MTTSINYLVGLLWKGGRDAQKAKSDIKDLGDAGDKSEKGLNKMSTGLDKAQSSMMSFKNAAIGGLVVGAGAALATFTKQSIEAAATVEETLSKSSVVFGDYFVETREELALFADEANRSQYDLIDMAAGIQALVVPMGLARGAASDLSVDMTKLSEDLASFNNTDATEAANAIKSGLAGESEPLKKYGVLLNEARVKQEALDSGIWDGVAALTELEKVQARVNLIMRDTTDAQGDAIKTADSYTNTVKGWEAAVKDLQVAWGQEFLPMLAPAVGSATGALKGGLGAISETKLINQARESGDISGFQEGMAQLDWLAHDNSRVHKWLTEAGLDYDTILQIAADSAGGYGAGSADKLFSKYRPGPELTDFGYTTANYGGPGYSLSQYDINRASEAHSDQLAEREAQAAEAAAAEQRAVLDAWTQAWTSVSGPVAKVIEAQEALDAAPLWDQAGALEAMAVASGELETSQKSWIYDLILGTEGATQKTMDLAVALGLISQAEADLQTQTAQTKQTLEELATTFEFGAINATSQADAIERIIGGMDSSEAMRRSTIDSQSDNIAGFFDAGRDSTVMGVLDVDSNPADDTLGTLDDDLNDWAQETYEADLALEDRDARDALKAFEQYLDQVTAPRTVRIDVQGGGVGGSSPDDGRIPEFAQGGSMVVPPGYPSDKFMVGVSSGEHIQVTPFGQSPQGQGGVTISIVNHIASGAKVNPREIERIQREATEQALKREGLL